MKSAKALCLRQFPAWLLMVMLLAFSHARMAAQTNATSQEGPIEPVSFLVTNAVATVYDLSGSYTFSQPVVFKDGSTGTFSSGLSLQQDAAGWLKGSGVTNVQFGTNTSQASYTVKGRVTGGGGKATRATFLARWQEKSTNNPGKPAFTISIVYTLTVQATGLNGTAKGTVRLHGFRSWDN